MNMQILISLYFYPRALAYHMYVWNSGAEALCGG